MAVFCVIIKRVSAQCPVEASLKKIIKGSVRVGYDFILTPSHDFSEAALNSVENICPVLHSIKTCMAFT